MSAKARRASIKFSLSTGFVLDSSRQRKPYSNPQQLLLQSERGTQQTSHQKSSLNARSASPNTSKVAAP